MAIVNTCYAMVAGNIETMTSWDYNLSEYISKGFSNLLAKKKTEDEAVEVGDEVESESEEPRNEEEKKLMDRIDQLLKMTDKTVHDEFQQNNDNWAAVLDEKLVEFQSSICTNSNKDAIRNLLNIKPLGLIKSVPKSPRRDSIRTSAAAVDDAVDEVSTQLWEHRV